VLSGVKVKINLLVASTLKVVTTGFFEMLVSATKLHGVTSDKTVFITEINLCIVIGRNTTEFTRCTKALSFMFGR
jgi:hypothetical protein